MEPGGEQRDKKNGFVGCGKHHFLQHKVGVGTWGLFIAECLTPAVVLAWRDQHNSAEPDHPYEEFRCRKELYTRENDTKATGVDLASETKRN